MTELDNFLALRVHPNYYELYADAAMAVAYVGTALAAIVCIMWAAVKYRMTRKPAK